MSDKDKYYIDGYGTKRPKDVPFWDSAKGQLVKKAGNDLLTTGSFALGLLLPFGKLKILKTLSRVLNGAAMFARDGLVKDKMVVHRAIALPKGKNKPDLQYKRTGENVYEIPETEKYVGSYEYSS